jgi:transcriptional regulator of acetoin/glycerol metabolism
MEIVHLSSILQETQWNVSKSAEILGIDRSTLYDKIKRYELRKPAP